MQVLPGMVGNDLPAAAGAGLGHCTQISLCGMKFWELLNAVCFIQSCFIQRGDIVLEDMR